MFDENEDEIDTTETAVSDEVTETIEELDNEESEDGALEMIADDGAKDLSETELAAFESEEVEDLEYIDDTQAISIIESVLFATDKPQGLGVFRQVFTGTSINKAKIKKLLDELTIDYAGGHRGITLEETTGGYQLRTKSDNMTFIKRMIKGRSFKLSGPALEVLSIVAYKQPCIKSQVDEIRGVESGHLLRGLMDRGLVGFGGKSELPGKPMFYQTSRKFLEIFGLRNLNELPTLSEIDELLPEGIDEENVENETLDQITSSLSKEALETYSESEEELGKITDQLTTISTSSDFFEQEKVRVKKEKDAHRAQDIEDAMIVGEDVAKKDTKWLEKYKVKLAEEAAAEESKGQTVVSCEPAEFEASTEDESTVEISEEDAELTKLAEAGEYSLSEEMQTSGEDAEFAALAGSGDEDQLKDNVGVADELQQETDLDFALKDHDFEGSDDITEAPVEFEFLNMKSSDEVVEAQESKIGEVSITDLKNDIDALS